MSTDLFCTWCGDEIDVDSGVIGIDGQPYCSDECADNGEGNE